MLPRLIHPMQISVDVLDRAAMLQDLQAREPIHGARSQPGESYVLPAQVKADRWKDPQPSTGGVQTMSAGYFLVRAYDMDQILGIGVRLKLGDHISGYTGNQGAEPVPCDLYITQVQPTIHYPQTGAAMYKCHFEDRDPVT